MSRTIEHEIHIEASPEIVFDVISNPKHLVHWFPDQAELDPTAGGQGVFTFHTSNGTDVAPVTVVDAEPYSRFSFRWSHAGEPATEANSLLVTFELVPAAGGTTLRMSETNFDGRGLDDARALAEYEDHTQGWDQIMPRLAPYAESLVAQR